MQAKVASLDSPKLLDQMRAKIRLHHYSIRTEESYPDIRNSDYGLLSDWLQQIAGDQAKQSTPQRDACT